MNLLAHRSFGKCESAVISVQKFHKNANLLISAHRMLGIYFRLKERIKISKGSDVVSVY